MSKTRETILENYFKNFKGLVAFDHPLAAHTSYRVGGPARIYAEPADLNELSSLLEIAEKAKLEVFVLGKGSNLLVSDQGYPGMVVNLRRCCSELEAEGERIKVGAGYSLDELISTCAKDDLSGLEALSGIPGTVGGALRMNAGAFDGTMYDHVLSVEVMGFDHRLETLPKTSLEILYRKVPALEGKIVLGCTLELTKAPPKSVIAKRHDILSKRNAKQPLDYPSCGSVFKRPAGHYVGSLIETAGCKGMRLGGAMVSEKHANFILNVDRAKAADIQGLIEKVKTMVFEHHGVRLETEVIFLGF